MIFPRNRKNLKIILFVSAAVIIIGVNYIFDGFVKNWVILSAGGLTKTFQNRFIKTSAFLRTIASAGKISEEIAKLKMENLNLIGETAELERLARENANLRSQLGVNGPHRELLAANVINLNKNPLASTIILNRGGRDGVEKNMAVIAGGNILAGMVKEVYEGSSLIYLLDDSRIRISARIINGKAVGYARGAFYRGLELEMIGKEEKVELDDLVITGGLDALPVSLVIGRISAVSSVEGALFQNITITPAYNPALYPELFIILK